MSALAHTYGIWPDRWEQRRILPASQLGDTGNALNL